MDVSQTIADYGVAIGITIIVVVLLTTFFYKYLQRLDKKFEDERDNNKYEREQKAKHDELMLEAERDRLEAEKETRRTYLSMTEELKKTTQMQAEILSNQSNELKSYSDRINSNTRAIDEHNQIFMSHIKKTGDRFNCVDNQLVSIAGMLEEIKHSTSDLVTKADLDKVQSGLDEYIRSKK